jgi:hypothetical protein
MTPRQQSILVGAVVTGILSTSYLGLLNTLCCLGVIVGGIVTVQQYVGRTGGLVEAGDGAVLGAAAGAAGAVLSAVFDAALRPFDLDSQAVQKSLQESMMQMVGEEEMNQMMQMQQAQGEGPALLSVMGLLMLAVNAILFAIFGAIGGAFGTALFGEETDRTGGATAADAEITDA